MFQVGLANIYRLLNKPLPEDISKPLDYWPSFNGTSSFNVKATSHYLRFRNSRSKSGNVHIKRFSVLVEKENIKYSVILDSAAPVLPYRLDIYMDLNNKRGAGLKRLLYGMETFLNPDDAWEFALRIENDKAYLYRSGRIKPKLIQEIDIREEPNTVYIPKKKLRGNPVKWGYQAILYAYVEEKKEEEPKEAKNSQTEQEKPEAAEIEAEKIYTWKIDDFLCQEDKQRQKLLRRSIKYLPALRASRK